MAETQVNTTAETQVTTAVENTQHTTQTATATTETNTTATEAPATETTTTTATEQTEPVTTVAEKTETVVTPSTVSFEESLKEYGFTKEELAELKAKRETERVEAEKPFTETKEWAQIIDFSAKNKLATADDFIEHKKINAEKNETLAFSKFKSEFVPNEEEKLLEENELQELIVEKFNEKYFIGNDNPTLKAAGEKEMEAAANEVRKPINDKILAAQNQFASAAMYQQHKIALAEFNKTVQTISSTIKGADGKEETISFEITPELTQQEVDTFLKSEENNVVLNEIFKAFTTNREAGDKGYGAVLTHLHNQKIQAVRDQKAMQTAFDKGLEIGKSMGIGAKAAFNSKENATPETVSDDKPLRQYTGGKFA